MNWITLLLSFAWILSGLAAHWQTVLLLPLTAYLTARGPAAYHYGSACTALLALLVSLLAPQPVPLLLLIMALGACLATGLEKFNPHHLHWRCLGGIALYAILSSGLLLFQAYLEGQVADNPLLAQGELYLRVLASIALYGFPIAYLTMLSQGALVHPPLPGGGSPDQLVHNLRA